MYKLTLTEYKKYFDDFYVSLSLFAFKYVNNIEEAKDITQDVFVKIWTNEIVFKSKENVKPYLYNAVKNNSLNYLKSKRYRSIDSISKLDLEKLSNNNFFFKEVVINETSSILEKAINTLPSKCAKVIRLSAKDLSNNEIAEELGVSINTIKTQKKIAYKKLKPILKGLYFLLILFCYFSFCINKQPF